MDPLYHMLTPEGKKQYRREIWESRLALMRKIPGFLLGVAILAGISLAMPPYARGWTFLGLAFCWYAFVKYVERTWIPSPPSPPKIKQKKEVENPEFTRYKRYAREKYGREWLEGSEYPQYLLERYGPDEYGEPNEPYAPTSWMTAMGYAQRHPKRIAARKAEGEAKLKKEKEAS